MSLSYLMWCVSPRVSISRNLKMPHGMPGYMELGQRADTVAAVGHGCGCWGFQKYGWMGGSFLPQLQDHRVFIPLTNIPGIVGVFMD